MKEIVCIYHRIDLDGFMSAAIVKHWFKTMVSLKPDVYKNYERSYRISEEGIGTVEKNRNGFQQNFLHFIGYNYGDPIPDLSEYKKVIMCDISFPKEMMEMLFDKLESNFIWIDHHISAIKAMFTEGERSIHPLGLQDTKFAACELTWQYFFPNEPMPEIVRLLGRYDCFGHKGTDEEQKVLEFQYGARAFISNYEQAYGYLTGSTVLSTVESTVESIHRYGKGIYKFLCEDAKQSYKNGFEIKLEEPNVFTPEVGSTNTVIRKFICINKERFNPINFGIKYHEDGYDGCACFHMGPDKMFNFSLYNDDGKVDVSAIAKQFGGGGHFSAAGFRINDLKQITG
jgi:oligoribonuclease NrnB/cAMP/cGMP phosphodiesterase (DHH superfamily)